MAGGDLLLEGGFEAAGPALEPFGGRGGAGLREKLQRSQPHGGEPVPFADEQIHHSGDLRRIADRRMAAAEGNAQPNSQVVEGHLGARQLESFEVAVVGDAVLNGLPVTHPASVLPGPETAQLGWTPLMPVGLQNLGWSAGAKAVMPGRHQPGRQRSAARPYGPVPGTAESALQRSGELAALAVDHLVPDKADLAFPIPHEHQTAARLGSPGFRFQAHRPEAINRRWREKLTFHTRISTTDEAEIAAVEAGGPAASDRLPVGA